MSTRDAALCLSLLCATQLWLAAQTPAAVPPKPAAIPKTRTLAAANLNPPKPPAGLCPGSRKPWLPRWETMAPQSTFGLESDSVKRGRVTFQAVCSHCHGTDADGGTDQELLRSGLIRGDSCGTEIKKLVATGRPDRGMPAIVLDDAKLNEIVDYLHRRIDEIDFSQLPSRPEMERALLTGDANAGRRYFNGAGGCSGCHSPDGDLQELQPDTMRSR